MMGMGYGVKGGQYYQVGDAVAFEKLGTIGVRGQVSRVMLVVLMRYTLQIVVLVIMKVT